MHTKLLGLAAAGVLALAGCENMTTGEQMTIGGLGGATAGLVTAEALDADDDWRLIAALGGATAGMLVARNTESQRCAYARGDGSYYVAPCPR